MSIIEQAAKRLEELRRAGIHVPVPPVVAAPAPPVAAAIPAAAPPVAREAAAPQAAVPPAAPDQAPDTDSAGPTAPPASAAQAGGASRRSREVHLDLARLEREGYLVSAQARSQLAEQMRIIKRPLLANVAKANIDGPDRIPRANLIQIVSAMPGEGKTFFAMNLAMSIAMEVDHSVLLVDADVLRPSVLARYGIEPAHGLMDVLEAASAASRSGQPPVLDLADVLLRTNVPKLSLLPAGTANAQSTEMLASAAMASLLDELAAKYSDRIVLFDAPPLIPTTESRVLASRVGQVLMVVEADQTTHAQVTQAYAAVEQCPVVLSVLNKCRSKTTGTYGYYQSN
jgi:receptor protein-tyrosine kinase